MIEHRLLGRCAPALVLTALLVVSSGTAPAQSVRPAGPSILTSVTSAHQKLEMTVNTSRILSLEKKIPQAQVNNPEILGVVALSPTQVQVNAKKAGVTQVNLWDENNQIYTIDVIVYGDASELSMILADQFPNSTLKVKPISNGVLISGQIDQHQHVGTIRQIAEEYYPKVIITANVGGVHQVLLHVKVMEVSRTKLRKLGIDWQWLSNDGVFSSMAAGVLTSGFSSATSGAETVAFSVLDGADSFFGLIEALRTDNLMKVLAEPTLVTVSGRPAFFHVGGETPVLVPQGFGTVEIQYKKYGTQVDFVPIVQGNGRIRLEVRPSVSEIDATRSVTVDSFNVPGFRKREVDTGVEMMAGQTLALAGLVQNRVEAERKGLPWVSDLPYVGAFFGRVQEVNNEVELLILVTPELVEAMDPNEVPPCGPGLRTTSPDDCELYCKRYIEVPKCCPPGYEHMNGSPNMAVPGMIGGMGDQTLPPGATIIRQDEGPAPPQPLPPAAESSQPPKPHPADSSHSRSRRYTPRRTTAPMPPRAQTASSRSATSGAKNGQLPGFIGPVGYDVVK